MLIPVLTNSALKVLDLSFNPFCGLAPATLSSFCEYFKTNPPLVHLSLSYTRLEQKDCDAIMDTINKSNNSIYGLHMAGLNVHIDNRGFLSYKQHSGVNETKIRGVQPVAKGRRAERGSAHI
mgnify:CR=1 FL=1